MFKKSKTAFTSSLIFEGVIGTPLVLGETEREQLISCKHHHYGDITVVLYRGGSANLIGLKTQINLLKAHLKSTKLKKYLIITAP